MNAGMEPLQARFRERAARDLDLLRRHLAADDVAAPKVEATAHKLAGSAALFGYAEVGLAARDVDLAFTAGRRPGRDLLEALVARLAGVCAVEPAASLTETPVAAAGGGETILIVEDDELLRAHAERQLRRLGYRVLVAAGGDDVLARLETLPPIDLLFTDLTLPGEAGGEALARAVRSRRPGLRVLFTSGKGGREAASAAAPGHPFLPKPYRRDALAATVRHALDQPVP